MTVLHGITGIGATDRSFPIDAYGFLSNGLACWAGLALFGLLKELQPLTLQLKLKKKEHQVAWRKDLNWTGLGPFLFQGD